MSRFHISICSFLMCLTVDPKNYGSEASICPKSYTPTDAWSKLYSHETQDWQVSGKDVYSFNPKMNFWRLKGTWISWVAFSCFPTTTTTIPGKNTLKFKHMVLKTSTQSPFLILKASPLDFICSPIKINMKNMYHHLHWKSFFFLRYLLMNARTVRIDLFKTNWDLN